MKRQGGTLQQWCTVHFPATESDPAYTIVVGSIHQDDR